MRDIKNKILKKKGLIISIITVSALALIFIGLYLAFNLTNGNEDISGDESKSQGEIVNGADLKKWIKFDGSTGNQNNDVEEVRIINSQNRYDLTEGWRLARVPDISSNGEDLSLPTYEEEGSKWINGVVPGTALGSYLKEGLIPDPYFGKNMLQISEKEYNVDYWYRNTFVFPTEFEGKRFWINFDGINWKAEIYINGSYVGLVEGPFTRGKFDVTEFVELDKPNGIAIKIIWCEAREVDTPTFICVNSWDFMPAIPGRNVGIYKDVYLSTSEMVTIEDPFIKTDLPLPDTDYADISVSTNVVNHSKETVNGTIKGLIMPGNVTFELPVSIDGEAQITESFSYDKFQQLRIDNPKLWWPNGMGDQNLYTLQLSFEADGNVSDVKTVVFGIREYSYDKARGGDLKISVNGKQVMIRGGNWGMPDAMLGWTDKEFDTAVRLNKEMNFNMIRTWHGTSDFDAFYDACDRYGIMVFEDFWLNGPHYPNEPEMFYANAEDKFKRLRNRACLTLWCGENEAIPPGDLNQFLEDTYNELDGTRMYVPASNITPLSGGISYGIEDPSWYFKSANGFVTEVGALSVPVIESLRKFIPDNKLWPVGNDVWEFHDFDFDIGNKQLDRYKDSVSSRYGTANNIEDFCEKAQLINLETWKAIFEGFNDKMWEGTSGVLVWMSQATWPSTIWQTYDYYFEPTGAYYGCKAACEPVHVQFNSYSGNVKVINNSHNQYSNATVEAKVYNLDGSLSMEKSSKVDIDPSAAVFCFDLFDLIGDNIAAGKKVTASSSAGDNKPEKATDNDSRSRWESGGRDNEWIKVDLGEVYDIDNIIITWEAAFAKSFSVQVSTDDEAWVDVYKKDSGIGGIDNIRFPSEKARYVRVNCTSPGTMWMYSIYDIAINSTGSTFVGNEDLSKVHFIKLLLKDENGNVISENTYWRSNEGTDYSDMDSLEDVDLEVSAKQEADKDNIIFTVDVKNTANLPAVGARLKLIDKESRENILPAFYSDNYFTLMPNESKVVTIEIDKTKVEPALMIEGYNIVEKEVRLQK